MYISEDPFTLGRNTFVLKLITDPDIYKKNFKRLSKIEKGIIDNLFKFKRMVISSTLFEPNLNKFEISHNRYIPIITPWDDINKDQSTLIEQFKKARNSLDFQNIGNTCRSIIQKLADHVFEPIKHTPTENIDVSKGMFKNRLHSYIKKELEDKGFKEIKNYSLELINLSEKAIDISNKTAHALNADSFIAESCIIGTISTINIIKIIDNNSKSN